MRDWESKRVSKDEKQMERRLVNSGDKEALVYNESRIKCSFTINIFKVKMVLSKSSNLSNSNMRSNI